MSFDLFIYLAVMAVIVLTGWGADKSLRKRDAAYRRWDDGVHVEPMTKEDERINALLAERRAKR